MVPTTKTRAVLRLIDALIPKPPIEMGGTIGRVRMAPLPGHAADYIRRSIEPMGRLITEPVYDPQTNSWKAVVSLTPWGPIADTELTM